MPFKQNILVGIITSMLLTTYMVNNVFAQTNDTIISVNNEFITDKLENLAESTDLNLDYSDLIADYYFYAKHPINLNGNDIVVLRNLMLINDIQLNNLRIYKQLYGQLLSIYELLSITGFDEKTVKELQPFVVVKQVTKVDVNPINIAKYGRHELLFRADRILEQKAGFVLPSDSAISHPGSVYLGDPQHFYMRYSFNYANKFRLGLTLDKDAGEAMFKGKLSDSIKQLIGNKLSKGYDFISAFAYAEDIGIISKILVGDFHLEFGQGITLWSGLSFGKSSDGVTIKKYGRGIRPNTSANENRYFRGAAMTVNWKKLTYTPFYSNNSIDGNIVPLVYNGQDGATSIIETGMHRTINELLDKNTIKVQVLGGNLGINLKKLSAGITVYNTKLNTPIAKSDYLYKYFTFTGTDITNIGADFAYSMKLVNFFGELSTSLNNSYAGIIGINTFLSDRLFLTLVYHNYGSNYHNLYSNPLAESSAISNENGIYLGYKALITDQISISGYIDHFSFPWLKYNVSAPSIGKDYLCQIDFNPEYDFLLYFRYRYKNKQENYKVDYKYLPELIDAKRHELRLFLSYKVVNFITLKNRFDVVNTRNNKSENEYGYLLYQDILLRPTKFPIETTFRYALFSTDGYDSRIYTYENDVLYAFSIPSYFDKGQRWYLMFRWEASRWLSVWLRYAKTTYFNKHTVGSGNELIEGNIKSELKFQLKIRL